MSRTAKRIITLFSGGGVSAPAAPTSLVATVVSTSRIDLAWVDNATDETEQRVYRSTDGVSYSLIDTIAVDLETYSDTTISAGVNYWFKVGSVNASGESLSNADGGNTLLLTLTSAWRFTESSDGSAPVTRVDAVTASGNDLTDTNNTPSTTHGTLGTGVLFVSANDDSLSRATNASLTMADNDFSVSCWVKFDTMPSVTNGIIMGKIDSQNILPTIEYILHVDTSGKARFGVTGATFGVAVSTATLTAGNMYHLIGSYNAATDTVSIKVNNGTADTAAFAGGITRSGNAFRFGWDGANEATRIDASVYKPRIARRIWTAAEHTALYNGGAGFDSDLDFLA